MIVGARQRFQSFRQYTWFLENNRPLSKFLYGILHLISVTKLQKNESTKANFILTTRATLNDRTILFLQYLWERDRDVFRNFSNDFCGTRKFFIKDL